MSKAIKHGVTWTGKPQSPMELATELLKDCKHAMKKHTPSGYRDRRREFQLLIERIDDLLLML